MSPDFETWIDKNILGTLPLRSVPYSTFYLQIFVAILLVTHILDQNFLIYVYCFIVFCDPNQSYQQPWFQLTITTCKSTEPSIYNHHALSRFFGVIKYYSFRSTEVQNYVSTRHAMVFINMIRLLGNSKFLKLEPQNGFKIQLTLLKSPFSWLLLDFQ